MQDVSQLTNPCTAKTMIPRDSKFTFVPPFRDALRKHFSKFKF